MDIRPQCKAPCRFRLLILAISMLIACVIKHCYIGLWSLLQIYRFTMCQCLLWFLRLRWLGDPCICSALPLRITASFMGLRVEYNLFVLSSFQVQAAQAPPVESCRCSITSPTSSVQVCTWQYDSICWSFRSPELYATPAAWDNSSEYLINSATIGKPRQ